ncbi:hypothetical protein D9613_004639 [Agrocybe pediades]|uniref:F-box domain-containing protein n=1 Tax=Agrocybe pediades TaxID=84607 RepID=A0A8H4VRA5_9AGAR|nr:hypothetical protein D9613_004639 [Agrocybe pediades]
MNIQSLNRDVLFMIFNFNVTDEDEPSMLPRLRTTLSASHVCRTFRDVLLFSPSIWGKLVHIDSSQGATSRSMVEEIMQRSGQTTPLWIEASQTRDRSDRESSRTARRELLLEILQSFWPRVQRISVVSDVDGYGIDRRISEIFRRPAPFLQIFKASIPLGPYLYKPEAQADIALSLFSQEAPSLRTFGYDGFHLPTTSPWYSNITHFDTVQGTALNRQLDDTLNILNLMPRLRYLRMLADGQFFWNVSHDEKDSITLPHLKYIELSNFEANSARELLRRVKPSPKGCLTNLRLEFDIWCGKLLSKTIIPVLKKNLRLLYGSAPPTLLSLDIGRFGLRILDAGTCLHLAHCEGRVKINLDQGISIDLNWESHLRKYDDDLMLRISGYRTAYCHLPILSSFFSSSRLRRVTWLRVTKLFFPYASLLAPFRDVLALEVHVKAISDLLRAIKLRETGKRLPRRDEEDSSEEEGLYQEEKQFDPEKLFPHLLDLRITVGNGCFYSYDGDPYDIHDFLQHRVRISKPIKNVRLVDDDVEAVHGFNYISNLVSCVEGTDLFIRKDGGWHQHVYVPSETKGNKKDHDDITDEEEGWSDDGASECSKC